MYYRIHQLMIYTKPINAANSLPVLAASLFVVELAGVALADVALVVVGDAVVFINTHNSPVASEVINILPKLSITNPTGLKHPVGHFELSALLKISVVAVVLFRAATGWPLEN